MNTILSLSARPSVGRACLHQQLRLSHCEACIVACPTKAITLKKGSVSIDDKMCTACGNCLFVCPTTALKNIPAPQRWFHKATLVAPFSLFPPTIEELLLWHTQHNIRAIEIDPDTFPGWLVAIAALNLRLDELGESLWTIVAPQEKRINPGRRRWLYIHHKDASSGSVSPGTDVNRNRFALSLNETLCYLCGACSRICSKNVIELNDENLTLRHSQCNGCQACTDVCIPQALKLTISINSPPTRLTVETKRCITCQQTFPGWPEGQNKCPICQRHAFGMREA
ncbi:4Fe-4S dicluster domain-containing protein [Erwinia sp. CPCC 100877]|nr:4Fe-4S dicluster domain-containing protein [Erwinia sp. CPCC 100877]